MADGGTLQSLRCAHCGCIECSHAMLHKTSTTSDSRPTVDSTDSQSGQLPISISEPMLFRHLSDPYSVLGLPYTARNRSDWSTTVRSAARALQRELHPDSLSKHRTTTASSISPMSSSVSAPNETIASRVVWVTPGGRWLRCDTRGFEDVTAAASALLQDSNSSPKSCYTGQVHRKPNSSCGATSDFFPGGQKISMAVNCAMEELQGLVTRADSSQETTATLSDDIIKLRVCEVLLEIDHREAASAAEMARNNDEDNTTLYEGSGKPKEDEIVDNIAATVGSYRKSSRRARRRAHKRETIFHKPIDPTAPTQHLHIANIGPRFEVSANEIARALGDIVDKEKRTNVTVTVPNSMAPFVYASFQTSADAEITRRRIDKRIAGSAPVLGRLVTASFAERNLPMVNTVSTAQTQELSPAELLVAVRRAMTSTVEEDAGNIPEKRSPPILVRCPLCSGSDAIFKSGRPFRMHLLSSVHDLANEDVPRIIETAEILARALECDMPVQAQKSRIKSSSSSAVDTVAPWLFAAQTGDWERLASLWASGKWDPGSTTDKNGSTALHWAAGSGHISCMRWLVETAGVPADQACVTGRGDGRTALHWAARNGQIAACQWLVDVKKVPIDILTVDGTTPFHWACWQGHFRCCRWLRDKGANVTAVNDYGCNGAHWAALAGNVPMCAWLSMVRVSLDQTNTQGHSPLHKAAFNGHSVVVEWLLNHTDIDPSAVDEGGYTPAGIARERGYLQLSETLEMAARSSISS